MSDSDVQQGRRGMNATFNVQLGTTNIIQNPNGTLRVLRTLDDTHATHGQDQCPCLEASLSVPIGLPLRALGADSKPLAAPWHRMAPQIDIRLTYKRTNHLGGCIVALVPEMTKEMPSSCSIFSALSVSAPLNDSCFV